MSPLGRRSQTGSARAGVVRVIVATLLVLGGAAGCDRPFQPFQENRNGPFSMVGYLDLKADTQWVRVMPIRRNLLAGPDPIDAVVTLEHPASGRTVTLRDSLFAYTDERLGGVAYAHIFWTTERLQPLGRYRLKATTSDGTASSVLVDMPADLEFTFLNFQRDTAWVEVRAERVLFVETIHLMRSPLGEPGGSSVRRAPRPSRPGSPGLYTFSIDGTPLRETGLVDTGRTEFRVAAARSDWPYPAGPSNLAGSVPDTMASNVENGLGFVGGVATWTVPFYRCTEVPPKPDHRQPCTVTFNGRSASISGKVIRQRCGLPAALAEIRLTQTYAGGGSAVLQWKTGWDGSYRFEGIEPGADLVLDLGPGTPAVQLPRLGPSQRYAVQDISSPQRC